MAEQNYSNHGKYVVGYHFVLAPLVAILLVWAVVDLLRFQDAGAVRGLIVALVAALLTYFCRAFPLKAQDRLIRLEERLRCAALLPAELVPRIDEIGSAQFVALRFASDEELPELVRAALDEKLPAKQIKQRIRVWRADHRRV
jgi:hypothetical protein